MSHFCSHRWDNKTDVICNNSMTCLYNQCIDMLMLCIVKYEIFFMAGKNIEVNRYTLYHFYFLPPQLLKERLCFQEKIIPFWQNPLEKGLFPQETHSGSKLFSFVKCQKSFPIKHTIFLWYKMEFFPFQNNPQNLDLSYKTDLDLWNCLGRVKFVL